MSASIGVFGYYGEHLRHEVITGATGTAVLVFEAPQRFYITQIHDKKLDGVIRDATLSQKKYGPDKKGRGGKVKKW